MTHYLAQQRPKLNEQLIFVQIVDQKDVKDYIIELNTEDQLYLKGIDSTGEPLRNRENDRTSYSPLTIRLKKQKGGKGARVENITLFDTGEFYESFDVDVDTGGFTIDADPEKDDTNLFVEWGEDIVGLTPESLELLVSLLVEKYVTFTREKIFLLT